MRSWSLQVFVVTACWETGPRAGTQSHTQEYHVVASRHCKRNSTMYLCRRHADFLNSGICKRDTLCHPESTSLHRLRSAPLSVVAATQVHRTTSHTISCPHPKCRRCGLKRFMQWYNFQKVRPTPLRSLLDDPFMGN